MKILLVFVLWFLFVFSVLADQFSYMESAQTSETATYYSSGDRQIQYNWDIENKYIFLGYRKASTCPYYCGITYDMIGLGLGVNHKIGIGNLYAQLGYYWIENNIGGTPYNENLYYYLNARFASFDNPKRFKSYEVTNSNEFSFSVGVDIPITSYLNFKVGYQYLKMKENIIGNFSDPPEFPNLWWDPVNRDLSTFNVGMGVVF